MNCRNTKTAYNSAALLPRTVYASPPYGGRCLAPPWGVAGRPSSAWRGPAGGAWGWRPGGARINAEAQGRQPLSPATGRLSVVAGPPLYLYTKVNADVPFIPSMADGFLEGPFGVILMFLWKQRSEKAFNGE
jgi:hypothetical protein